MEEPKAHQSKDPEAIMAPRSGELQASRGDLEKTHYLTGTKLYIVFVSLGFSVLLMALDVSVIATVRNSSPSICAIQFADDMS